MAADPKAMVKEGIRLYKANQKAEARAIWEQVTELDPYNEQAWLWLSAVVESPEDQRVCLENVLFINPDNPNAKKGLAALDARKPPLDSTKSGGSGSSPSPSAPPARPAAPPIATSSSSTSFVPPSTPPEVYDDWIGSLNLPNSGKQESSKSAPADTWTVPDDLPSTSPFTTTDFDDADSVSPFSTSDSADTSLFADDDDNGDSYQVFTPSSSATSAPSYTPSDDLGADDLRALMASDDDDFDDDDVFSSSPASSSSAAAFHDYSLDDDDDDVFSDDFGTFTPSPSGAASASSQRSSSQRSSGQREEYDLGDDPFSSTPFPDSRLPKTNPFTADTLDFDDDAVLGGSDHAAYGFTTLGEDADPAEYFAMIPDSIKARQLPGSDEKYPVLLRLMFVVLLLLNLGAVILLVVQMVL